MAVRPRGRRRKRVEKPQTPGLTRAEYLTLLKTARDMGRERAYLLIKTMGDAGINSMELSGVTIEALRTGRVQTERFNLRRAVTVPEPLRTELLDYAARSGVTAGPVFVTRDGDPILHPFVWREVKRVCKQTGISEEKGTPKNLRQLYLNTYKGVQAEHMDNTDAAYQRLLEYEERDVGWAV